MSRLPAPHSFLTALSPIDRQDAAAGARLAAIRAVLGAHSQYGSPFRECPTAHMVRMQVIDALKPAMGDTSGVHLRSAWLLCVAELDGGVDDFLDALYRTDPDFVHATWGQCTGYPPYRGAVFLRRYIARCRMGGELPYAAFPASVAQVQAAIARKECLGALAATTQGLGDAAAQAAFRAARGELERPTATRPGGL